MKIHVVLIVVLLVVIGVQEYEISNLRTEITNHLEWQEKTNDGLADAINHLQGEMERIQMNITGRK